MPIRVDRGNYTGSLMLATKLDLGRCYAVVWLVGC